MLDPEADGIPGYADDDSTAWSDGETGRSADGPDPAALPADHPVAVDRFGTTAAEQRAGQSLDARLAEEEPDLAPDGGATPRDPVLRGTLGDADRTDPHLDSPVSVYDRSDWGRDETAVGRLVDPDLGAAEDTEPQAIADDVGIAGGGASAEELAVHQVPQEFEP